MGYEPCIKFASFEVAAHIFATKTISDSADSLAAESSAHLPKYSIDDGIHPGRQVLVVPAHYIKIRPIVDWDGVSVEEVGHHHEVAAGGKLICHQVGVDEAMAIAISEKQDGIFCRPTRWIGDVGRDCRTVSGGNDSVVGTHYWQFLGLLRWPCPRAGVPPDSTQMVRWMSLLQ